jgi:hypothetical protein
MEHVYLQVKPLFIMVPILMIKKGHIIENQPLAAIRPLSTWFEQRRYLH